MNYLDEENEEGLTPEQRQQVHQSLLSKYQAANNDNADIEKAEKGAKNKQALLGLVEGVSGLAAARAGEGRVKLADNSGYWNNLKKGADSEVADARQKKQEKVQNVLTEDKLGAQDRENDPNSEESKIAQALAMKLMPNRDFSQASAARLKTMLPSIQSMYNAEQQSISRAEEIKARNAAATEAKEDRNFYKQQALDEKKEKDLRDREVGGVGVARTRDDAKNLKEATELKSSFDRNIDEMIDLRKQYGTEYYNREAVERGQQLSKDLLLQYKQLAKLGVLSHSDTAILNKIIPEDPLGNDWAPGQDPIMHRMKKFKADSDADYQKRLETRLERRSFPFLIRNPKTNEEVEVENEQELKEAQAEGFR